MARCKVLIAYACIVVTSLLATITPSSSVGEVFDWEMFMPAIMYGARTGGTLPNNPPSASFTFNCANLGCSFSDTSTDSDGSVTSWSWNFGDGTVLSTRNPSHTYAASGTYSVTLTVTDDDGASNATTQSVTVVQPNAPPSASFTFNCVNLGCSFSDTSTDNDGSVTSWSWNFGDGTGSSTRFPTHTYAAAGTYSVSLTVIDNSGASGYTFRSVSVQNSSLTDLQLLIGNWGFTYTIISTFTDYYSLNSTQYVNGVYVLTGIDQFGGLVIVALSDDLVPGSGALLGKYTLIDEGSLFDQLFTFDLIGTNTVSGLLTWLDPVTGDVSCGSCPWPFIGLRSSTAINAQGASIPLQNHSLVEKNALDEDMALAQRGTPSGISANASQQLKETANKLFEVIRLMK